MAHHLVLFLGTGPMRPSAPGGDASPAGLAREGTYRRARYALDDGTGGFSSKPVETPFVGAALLRLLPAGTFTHVHLFGSATSMWDTLALDLGDDDDGWMGLAYSIHGGGLADGDPLLAGLAQRFGAAHGLEATCRVLPLPDTDAHTWELLRRLADLPGLADGDTLSLDVTHGLRVQPLFALLAARYLQAVRPRLRLEHVFYGALDLQRDGVAPVFDLRPHVALLDWIDAARAFERSADAGPLAAMLGDSGRALAGRAVELSRTLQANALPRFRSDAGAFLSTLRNEPEGNVPLDLVRPALERLPRRANAGRPWEALLFVAEHHAEHERLGLALLSAWEAARARLTDAYEQGGRALLRPEGEHVDRLLKTVGALDRLRLDRNAVAHATLYASQRDNDRLRELRGRVPEVIADVRKLLESTDLDDLAQTTPWPH